MSWLTPQQALDSDRVDPHAYVEAFVEKHGELGRVVLGAWNKVDPFHCLYMPDEYLGYAERFMGVLATTLPEDRTIYLVEELVRRSFYPQQVCHNPNLGRPWVLPEDIETIAGHIVLTGLHLVEEEDSPES